MRVFSCMHVIGAFERKLCKLGFWKSGHNSYAVIHGFHYVCAFDKADYNFTFLATASRACVGTA